MIDTHQNMPISLILTPFDHYQIRLTFAVTPNLILEPCLKQLYHLWFLTSLFFAVASLIVVIIVHNILVQMSLSAMGNHLVKKFGRKEDNLNPANDGEPREESHRASNETQLGLHLDLLVSLDVVEGRRVKVDLNQLKG